MSGRTLTQITAGQYQTCAVDSPGTQYCWGLNSSGQAGNRATSVNFQLPAPVTPAAAMIASGYRHSCLLRDGKAYCWGDDSYGELGNNTTRSTPQTTPVAVYTGGVLSGVTLTQISAGSDCDLRAVQRGRRLLLGRGQQRPAGQRRDRRQTVPVAVTRSGVLAGVTLTQISAGATPCARCPRRAPPTAGALTTTGSWATAAPPPATSPWR